MREILLAYKIPDKIVNVIMMLNTDTRSIVRSPDRDTDFFKITSGVLQVDSSAP